MLNKLFLAMGVILLIGMAYIAYSGTAAGGPDAIMAGPAGVSSETLRNLNNEKFMFASKGESRASAATDIASGQATLFSVNEAYGEVWGQEILDGGYLTKIQREDHERAAVLNEAAAFHLFGAVSVSGQIVTIDGSKYLVTGVVDDGSEDNHIYVPYTVLDMRQYIITAVYAQKEGIAKNDVVERLIALGVTGDGAYIDTRLYRRLPAEMFQTACYLGIVILCFFVLRRTGKDQVDTTKKLWAESKKYYFGQIMRDNKKMIFRFVGGILLAGLFLWLMYFCLAGMLDFMLVYNEILPEMAKNRFTMDYAELQPYGNRAMAAALLCLFHLVCILCILLLQIKKMIEKRQNFG